MAFEGALRGEGGFRRSPEEMVLFLLACFLELPSLPLNSQWPSMQKLIGIKQLAARASRTSPSALKGQSGTAEQFIYPL